MIQHRYIRPFLALFLLISALSLVFTTQAATRIYRTVDAQGNVVFTDVPPKDGENSAAINVEAPNTFNPAPTTMSGQREAWNVGQQETTEVSTFTYNSVAIVSPTNDQAVRENAGNITFEVVVDPELQTGHRLRLLLDGKPEQEGPQLSFMLVNLDRGTHSANVEIIDDAGNVLMVSNPISFHMMRVAAAPRPTPRAN